MQLTDLILSTLAFASVALAASSSSDVTVHVVEVGANSTLTFSPDELTVTPGDMVQFQFYPKNHTVTQSTFANPCVPISEEMTNVTGINSGFMPVAADATTRPVFTLQINDTTPIWVYCAQAGHCAKGMVMAINVKSGSNKTLAAYKALAEATSTSSSSNSSSSSSGSSGSSGSSTSSGTSTTSSTSSAQTTNAAAKPVVNSLGLIGLFIAGLSFAGL